MRLLLVALLLTSRWLPADDAQPVPAQFTGKSIFLSAISKAPVGALPQRHISGITVPHHLLARDLIANTFALASRGSYKRVIAMSPDHNNLGETDISLAGSNFATVFGEVETDRLLIKQLEQLPNVSTSRFFYREHGIQAILPFIKYYFPHARVVAIAFKGSTRKKELDTFISFLETVLDKDTLIVQSTDFSHYLPVEDANVKDSETLAVLTSGDPQKVFSLRQPGHLDSVAAQYVQMRLQKDLFGARAQITNHKNSQDYSSKKLTKTTSYLTQIYVPRPAKAAIIAVGDIMLGRMVEGLMERRGAGYPFQRLSKALGDADAAVGNLEGAINSDHVRTPEGSLAFSFTPGTSRTLAENHFAILSLANNHTYDFGENGFADTTRYLESQSIRAIGHPRRVDQKYAYTRNINGRQFSFVSLNATSYFDVNAAVTLVSEVKNDHPGAFLVVLIHWGIEYSLLQNGAQRSLAHKLIDGGADFIIGSHPHVVQGIESYKHKLVFYSLGNFIFDQYFSSETQQGLMLRLEVGDKNANCLLVPLQIVTSRPQIMEAPKAREWLADLSLRSSSSLKDQILDGTLIVY